MADVLRVEGGVEGLRAALLLMPVVPMGEGEGEYDVRL